MSITRIQKISIAFFAFTLISSYLIAHWLHDSKVAVITSELKEEGDLNHSTEKLLMNCEQNEKKENDQYSANHLICEQGLQERELSAHALEALAQDKARTDTRFYRNFFLSVLLMNLFALAMYKCNAFLKRAEK